KSSDHGSRTTRWLKRCAILTGFRARFTVRRIRLWQAFKAFAMKGNVVDLAVGVIIGAAFGLIVSSLVQDVLMPPLGWLTGGLDFKDKVIVVQHQGEAHRITGKKLEKDVVISYGKFINAVINFLIVAISIFAMIK